MAYNLSFNSPWFYDELEKMEHILIGGTTGSGKSVALNGFIIHLLKHNPNELGLVLIDPKRVELAEYKALPHTLAHAYEIEDINKVLIKCEQVMDNRYKEMTPKGIKKYDGKQIYIIIDEYAAVGGKYGNASKEAMKSLARIAFMGRAANIHIVACTQRPCREVIEGLIANNFTTTLALRTKDPQDSRNLVGVKGCETLPRYGEGFLQSPNFTTLQKLKIDPVPDSLKQSVFRYWAA